MPALHIRQVDDAVIASLKQRAARNQRSLEAELRCVLREAAFGAQEPATQKTRLRLKTVDVNPPTDFGREDMYDDAK